ncbi:MULTISPECIES: recombinase family protein [Pseudoalteromonas]|uniref:recombinase family protein n=1 Tax=Pseudoalteromonas TaxID=53246 RepID=UPI000452F83D|nr:MULTISPECIES: recombinase family protein [Pseudoalteromonas]EWH04266.1 resolvase [Pseudoalteromonas lipolytica SCSIO 04301]MCG9735459.1 recombinase family protein [Pseudoalteromonas shioyasakiensis]|tara:strand:+ start:5256 stop:5834 length:579 start_codon:yes stop_codon:yes gene_type:complete
MSKHQTVAYIRVSSSQQSTDRQLVDVSYDKAFIEKASAKSTERPQLQAMLNHVREGDEVVVHSMDRLARNTKDLLEIVESLKSKGVSVKFMKENLTFTAGGESSINNLMLTMLSAVAQFERELILERQREGIEAAKKKGKYKGRSASINREEVMRDINSGLSVRKTSAKHNIAVSSVSRIIKEAKKESIQNQ